MFSRSVVSDSLWPHGLQPTRLLCPWGFYRQEYWSELSCPSPGDLPNPGLEPRSPTSKGGSLPSEPPGKPNLYWRVLISAAQETVPVVGPGEPTPVCQFTHSPTPCSQEGAWVRLPCLQADLPTWSISGNLNTTFPSSPTTKHQTYLTPHSLLCLCLPLSLPHYKVYEVLVLWDWTQTLGSERTECSLEHLLRE